MTSRKSRSQRKKPSAKPSLDAASLHLEVSPLARRSEQLLQQRDTLVAEITAIEQELKELQHRLGNHGSAIFGQMSAFMQHSKDLLAEIQTVLDKLVHAKRFSKRQRGFLLDFRDIFSEMAQSVAPDLELPTPEEMARLQRELHDQELAQKNSTASDTSRATREIYLRIATQFHPDKATNPEQAEHFTKIMQEVTSAYKRGDVAALLAAEVQALSNPDSVQITNSESLQRAVSQLEAEISLLKTQRKKAAKELTKLKNSEPNRMTDGLSPEDIVKVMQQELSMGTQPLEETKELFTNLLAGRITFDTLIAHMEELAPLLFDEEEDDGDDFDIFAEMDQMERDLEQILKAQQSHRPRKEKKGAKREEHVDTGQGTLFTDE